MSGLPPIAVKERNSALSPSMCRDARALLRISQEELAELAGISVSTVRRLERGDAVGDYPQQRILAALEGAGAVFVGTVGWALADREAGGAVSALRPNPDTHLSSGSPAKRPFMMASLPSTCGLLALLSSR